MINFGHEMYFKGCHWVFFWKEWCWSWNSSTLATSWEELTHWKRLWCWEGLGAGGERDNRGWDGWMASLTQWTWVWVSSGSWWWTGRPGVLQAMGSQRVGHDWATELNWTWWDKWVWFWYIFPELSILALFIYLPSFRLFTFLNMQPTDFRVYVSILEPYCFILQYINVTNQCYTP